MSIIIIGGGFCGIIPGTDPNTVVSADNGLTENTPGNVQLGGTMLKDTTINLATFFLRLRDGDFTLESCTVNINDTNVSINANSTIDGHGYTVQCPNLNLLGAATATISGFDLNGILTTSKITFASGFKLVNISTDNNVPASFDKGLYFQIDNGDQYQVAAKKI